MSDRLLLLRADANPQIGAGHLMRSLALALAWRKLGGQVEVVGALEPEAVRQRVTSQGISLTRPDHSPDLREDAAFTRDLATQRGAAWVVADGYPFTPEYLASLGGTGTLVATIDDTASLSEYPVDLILNQNAGAPELEYPDTWARKLLGTRYALLRPEFAAPPGERPVPTRARRVLVTLGGADPDRVTEKVVAGLAAVDDLDLELRVVAGPANRRLESLGQVVSEIRGAGLEARLEANVQDMVPLMQWADLAVTAAGSTCWELAAQRVPMVTLTVADNQTGVAAALQDAGAALGLGWHHEVDPAWMADTVRSLCLDPKRRRLLSLKAAMLVDGRGAERVARILDHLAEAHTLPAGRLGFRPGTLDDCRQLFTWANDPVTRASAFDQNPIEWESHVAWFSRMMSSPGQHQLIATLNGTPVGQIRFSLMEPDLWEIDISIDPASRGRGLGARVLRLAAERFFLRRPQARLRALVKPTNTASARAFQRAGFLHTGEVRRHGQTVLEYRLLGLDPFEPQLS